MLVQAEGERPFAVPIRHLRTTAGPDTSWIGAFTPFDFDSRNLTAYGGLLPVATMLERLGFQQLVEETLTVKRVTRSMSMFGRSFVGILLPVDHHLGDSRKSAAYEGRGVQFIISARKTARLVEELKAAVRKPARGVGPPRLFWRHAGRVGVSYSHHYPEQAIFRLLMDRLRAITREGQLFGPVLAAALRE